MTLTLAWVGDGAARIEVARVDRDSHGITATGTQLGAIYELRYLLRPASLWLEVVGERSIELDLDGADFFDVGWSPLFNSLPVIRDALLDPGPPRDYVMRWVDVPALDVRLSEQRYEPLGNGVVRFSSGSFTADIQFDEAGFVISYPGIGTRLSGN
ncbi:MAG TPA: putative glycolipid-binding domain-containing protein [Solirubrobacteraceae bacterium]|nr:putative glycolipid-binding domain-containing protein [Solirubrobacteraceae bacterium]